MHEFEEKLVNSFGEMGEKVKYSLFGPLGLYFGPFKQFKGDKIYAPHKGAHEVSNA